MRLDDLPETENVDDRRGQGGGGFGGFGGRGLAIGGGGLGTVVIIILALLFGVDPRALLGGSDQAAPPQQQAPVADGQAGPRADDAQFHAARRIVGSTEQVWGALFQQAGRQYTPAIFTPYDGATETQGCGSGQSAMGPFYCPADQRVYIDLSFFNELANRFGAPGQFAQAYVIAHEVGHHVQDLLGTTQMAEQMEQGGDANRVSVMVELQADCFAGVWANQANRQHPGMIENGDIEQGIAAASAVGDDTLQRSAGREVTPDSFTHGSSAQRVRWFRTGFDSGDPRSCDTFGNGRAFG
jgi:predicted metalloprotease